MGKTYLMEDLADQQPRVLVVDSKHRVRWSGYHLTHNPVATLLEDKVIYRPPNGVPPDDFWVHAMRSLHERGGGVIYIDELSLVCTPNRIPAGLAEVFRVGRELGVGVWWSIQEAVALHNTPLRQSDQIMMFYNQGASDREKLLGAVGDMAEVTEHLPEYHFIVFVRGETRGGDEVPTYMVDHE